MRKNKRARGIISSLTGSYLLFAVLLIVIGLISLIGSLFWLTEGNPAGVNPYAIMDAEGKLSDPNAVLSLNGWIEELDREYRVIDVYGNKKSQEMIYTPERLFRLVSYDPDSSEEYLGTLIEKPEDSGYYMVFYNRKDVSISPFTINISSTGTRADGYQFFVVLLLVLFFLLCIGMGYYLRAKINRPLKQLVNAMKQVQEGTEGLRLDFKTEAEFALIRDAFNQMIDSLEQARAEREESEKSKNRILLELSHDIKTPIATINSYAVALEQGLVTEEKEQMYYETIRLKAERVNKMADDMFTMLKMKSREYKIGKDEKDICEFLRRQCVQYYEEAANRGLEIAARIPEKHIFCKADFLLLERVVGNLIENAMKYNKTGDRILVTLDEGEKEIRITVQDDGLPIHNSEVGGDIFEAFVRGDKSRRTDGGTGLGLTIAREIVEKHSGTISYVYEEKWNIFIFTIPL